MIATLAALGGLVLASGCGGSKPDATKGKQLFTQRCGSCHTIADAGTKGIIGPNLDDAFKQAIADGLGRDTVEGVVDEQIAFPQGGQMPANLVRGDDRKAVAAYVAEAVGKRGGATGATGPAGGGGGGTAKANAKNEVEIPTDPTGQLAFKFKSATAKAGKVTLLSKNDSPVPHDISIKDGVNVQGKQVSNGGVSKASTNLKAGTYEFYCSVPGHEQGGMKGTLTVK